MPSQHVLTQEEWVAAMAKRAMDRIRSELYLDLRYMNAALGALVPTPAAGLHNLATDGAAFTGAVTVSVTVDAGTQATGSVGSGACTHEGNGYHTYAPAQAETNGDLLAFTFTGSGAIPETVQVYTSFPQTVDLSTGITAGTITTVTNLTNAPSAGDFTATMKTSIGTAVAASAVASVTGNVGGNVSGSVGSVVGAVGSVTGLTASDVGAIKAKTDSLTFTKALELDTNIQSVNGVTVNGDGAGTPMGV